MCPCIRRKLPVSLKITVHAGIKSPELETMFAQQDSTTYSTHICHRVYTFLLLLLLLRLFIPPHYFHCFLLLTTGVGGAGPPLVVVSVRSLSLPLPLWLLHLPSQPFNTFSMSKSISWTDTNGTSSHLLCVPSPLALTSCLLYKLTTSYARGYALRTQ